MGYALFDSAMPTRDARHGRLYAFRDGGAGAALTPAGAWLTYVYITDEKQTKRADPICPECDCPCCARYSAGYLHHLFKIGDHSFPRLATLHNLRFMARLTARLRETPDG
jgi:queuine tRNA-ribosyltransferase